MPPNYRDFFGASSPRSRILSRGFHPPWFPPREFSFGRVNGIVSCFETKSLYFCGLYEIMAHFPGRNRLSGCLGGSGCNKSYVKSTRRNRLNAMDIRKTLVTILLQPTPCNKVTFCGYLHLGVPPIWRNSPDSALLDPRIAEFEQWVALAGYKPWWRRGVSMSRLSRRSLASRKRLLEK
jgi:hypothetical protein